MAVLPRAFTPSAQLLTCLVIQTSRISVDPMCPPSVRAHASCWTVVPLVAALASASVTWAGRMYCDFAGSGNTPRDGPIFPSRFIRGRAALPLAVAEKLSAYQTCIGDGNSRFSCSAKTATLMLYRGIAIGSPCITPSLLRIILGVRSPGILITSWEKCL